MSTWSHGSDIGGTGTVALPRGAVPTWDHGSATLTVTRASAARAVANAARIRAANPPKLSAHQLHVLHMQHVAATQVRRPAAIAPRPVTVTPSPTSPSAAPSVARPAAMGGMSLGVIAIVAGGLFLLIVLLARRKRR